MPKISVIIPNYNHGQFLEKRVQSILNQTYQNFEIIYLDDASADSSNEEFAKFANDHRVAAQVINKVNSGNPFRQWNKGVSLARGEYVWIAESDDYADEDFLATLVRVLDNNPKIGLVYCHSPFVDERDTVTQWSLGERWQQSFINDGRSECLQHLIFRNTIPNASAVLFRRSVYQRVGCADETMVFCGDWLMWVKMLLVSNIAYIAEPLNYYRKHQQTVSAKVGRTSTYIEESYRVVSYIKQNLDIPKDVLERSCKSLMGMWVSFLFTKQSMKEWRRNSLICNRAKEVDSRLSFRFIETVAKLSARWLRRNVAATALQSRRNS